MKMFWLQMGEKKARLLRDILVAAQMGSHLEKEERKLLSELSISLDRQLLKPKGEKQ